MHKIMAALVVAAGFVTAAGCGSTVVTGSGCPEQKPVTGAICTAPGESCDYQDGPCVMTFACDAQEKAWSVDSSVCVPAAVDCWAASDGDVCAIPGETCGEGGDCGGFENECGDDHRWQTVYYDGGDCWDPCEGFYECPATPPAEGSACEPSCPGTSACNYPDGCGGTYATCGDDGQWHLAIGDCPPPPVDPCSAYGAQTDCEASGCRWLVPGCGDPPLPQAGCYAPTDCTPADCASPYFTCQEVVYDPCYGQACNACGASAFLCLP